MAFLSMKQRDLWIIILTILVIVSLILNIYLISENSKIQKKLNYNFIGDKNNLKSICQATGGNLEYIDSDNYFRCDWGSVGLGVDYRSFLD